MSRTRTTVVPVFVLLAAMTVTTAAQSPPLVTLTRSRERRRW